MGLREPFVHLPGGLRTILNRVTIRHTCEHFVDDYRCVQRERRLYTEIAVGDIRVRTRETGA